jgi:hypothetical protein
VKQVFVRRTNQILNPPKSTRQLWSRLLVACIAGLAPVLVSCSLLHLPHSQPNAAVGSLQLTTNAAGKVVSVTLLHAKVMRFADEYVSTLAQAADDFGARAATSEARLAALRWKLGQATSAYIVATGVNPVMNALDMLVLVTMARIVVEDHFIGTFGEAAQPLLATQIKLESDLWQMASGGVLKPEQQQELRDMIQEWRRKNPNQRYVGMIRFQEFLTALGRTPTRATTKRTSIFSLLYLDPMAGLDPTAAAIEETRRLGERAMFYTQRMPTLLSWQTQVLAYQLADQPESKQLLEDVRRLTVSAESFAKTAEQLPALINDQRQAAIQQIFDNLASEEKKTRELLTETRQTLNSANEMAISVNTAIKSLDEFVRYVSPTNTGPMVVATNNKPFDVLDYGKAATQIGAAATNINSLLASVNQSTPELARLSQQTAADVERVVQRAFRLGLALIAILLIGSVLAGLTYRVLANKLVSEGRKPSAPSP